MVWSPSYGLSKVGMIFGANNIAARFPGCGTFGANNIASPFSLGGNFGAMNNTGGFSNCFLKLLEDY